MDRLRAEYGEVYNLPFGVSRCPGDSCARWIMGEGVTYEEKVANGAALGCDRCHGRPPLPEDERIDDEVLLTLIGSARELINARNAGVLTDLTEMTPEEWRVICAIEQIEKQVDRTLQVRLVEALTRS